MRVLVLAVIGAALWASTASANVIQARQEIGRIMYELNCYATDVEIRENAKNAGIGKRDMVGALRMMRQEGVIGTGRVDGVPVIELRGEAGCKGPRFEKFRQILGEPAGPDTQKAILFIKRYMEQEGCVATRAELVGVGDYEGYTPGGVATALQIMGSSLETIRVDGGNYGMRLHGTARCP